MPENATGSSRGSFSARAERKLLRNGVTFTVHGRTELDGDHVDVALKKDVIEVVGHGSDNNEALKDAIRVWNATIAEYPRL